MSNQTIPPGTVVVGYSGERDAEHALTWAAEKAALENRTLSLVHVMEPIGGFATSSLAGAYMALEDIDDAVEQGGREILARGADLVAERFPDVDVELHLLAGTPEHVLRDLGVQAACLVVGSRGRGRFASALLGSVSVTLANTAVCPVVVVRPFHHGKVRNGVLVGTDCGRNTRSTLEFAYREASERGLPLTVLHSVPGFDLDSPETDHEQRRRNLAEAVAGLAEKFPDVRARTALGSGSPEKWLVSQSEAMDLVVVGHHRPAGLSDRLALGSYAPMLVEQAACPVAVVNEVPVA
ncbi:MAG: universal stress protein [Propionibacteriales bacterium]|nr:universal stress protein [Propionibacteriales bacterium]